LYGGADKSDQTGSITPPPGSKQAAVSPPDGDQAYARAAANDVLSRGGKDASAPWENPRTGARGTVTPIASAYSQDGQTCRDFLASFISGSSQSWMQGEACKQSQGPWEVRALKPWKRS
jgi:surface antigen